MFNWGVLTGAANKKHKKKISPESANEFRENEVF